MSNKTKPLGLNFLEFVCAVLVSLVAQDIWQNTAVSWREWIAGLVGLILYIYSIRAMQRYTNELTKDNDKLAKQLEEAGKELKRYEGRVEYHWEHAFDDTFARVLEKLQQGSNYDVRLLNYTGTGFPDRFCRNAADLLITALNKAIPVGGGDDLSLDGITISVSKIKEPTEKEPRLFNLKAILDKLRDKGISNMDQLREKVGTSRGNLDSAIKDITNSVTKDKNQAAYLARENFWLWDPASSFKLVRMYYLSPDNRQLDNTAERFSFVCASIVNGLFAPRYSLGILPGRLGYAHSDQFNYYIINALSLDRSSAWVLSGLGTRKQKGSTEELPYSLVFRAGEDEKEWVVGCKCQQISDYSKLIWSELKKASLVLFDSETSPPSLNWSRFAQFYARIHAGLAKQSGDLRARAFQEFFDSFNGIVNWAFSNGLAQEMRIPLPSPNDHYLIGGEIEWKNHDIEQFQSFFLQTM